MRLRLLCLLVATIAACTNDEADPVAARPVATPLANSMSDGTTIRIGTLPQSLGSHGLAINNRGQVRVQLILGCCNFMWEAGAASGNVNGTLRSLNDQGQMVGDAYARAIMYQYPDPSPLDLGALQPNGRSTAWSINQSGSVVGRGSTSV